MTNERNTILLSSSAYGRGASGCGRNAVKPDKRMGACGMSTVLYVAYNWRKDNEDGSGYILLPIKGPRLLTPETVTQVVNYITTNEAVDKAVPVNFIWLDDEAA